MRSVNSFFEGDEIKDKLDSVVDYFETRYLADENNDAELPILTYAEERQLRAE